MKLLAVISSVLLISIASIQAGPCDYDALKSCYNMGNLLSQSQGVKWPTNDGEVQSVCGKLKEGFECVKKFNQDCVTKESERTLLQGLGKRLTDHHHEVCDSTEGRAGFLRRVANCYGKPEVNSGMRNAYARFVGLIEKTATFDKGSRLGAICCSVLYMKGQAKQIIEQSCDAESLQYLSNKMTQMGGEKFRTMCPLPDGTTAEQCAANLSDSVRAELGAILHAASPPQTKYPVALPTMFQMWKERSASS